MSDCDILNILTMAITEFDNCKKLFTDDNNEKLFAYAYLHGYIKATQQTNKQ